MGDLKLNVKLEHWYRGELIDIQLFHNDTTNEGKNRYLNVGFHGYAPITNWYSGIISGSGYTSVAATDTYIGINKSANAWVELTSYTDTNNGDSSTTRPTWITNPASGLSISNATKMIFLSTTAASIRGIFIVGGSPESQIKGDNTPGNSILWATALLDSAYPIILDSNIRITYTVNS
jgi:hypothetical protein